MKRLFLIALFAGQMCLLFAQTKPYSETADAMRQISVAVDSAAHSGKYVIAQVGGNWCPWCLRFAQFADTNQAVHKLFDDNFVYIHINYSKANRNPEAMKRLGNPARFGFPVFVILDEAGRVIHIQSSGYLEEGKGYSEKKVLECFANWTPTAVNTLK
ncbi:MAG: thioredoxin family protein [Bacteroidales bacterium]|nr:thioredoxin family protein [Bacteroidales bacterium]